MWYKKPLSVFYADCQLFTKFNLHLFLSSIIFLAGEVVHHPKVAIK